MTVHRVMLVDDDASLRSLVRVTLPRDGFEIAEARDGQDALDQIAAGPPDLVVLDWRLPERSGEEVLKELKVRQPELPVVVLTAEPREREAAERLGADEFLTKPFSPLELVRTIERLLAERLLDQAP